MSTTQNFEFSRATFERIFAGLLFGAAAAIVATGLLEMCLQPLFPAA
jgi:hypothetical protein